MHVSCTHVLKLLSSFCGTSSGFFGEDSITSVLVVL